MNSMTHSVARDIALAAADLKRGHKKSKQMVFGLVSVLCICLLTILISMSSMPKANAAEEMVRTCPKVIPCGWVIYDIHSSRRIPYYTKNICKCPIGTTCFMAEERVPVHSISFFCEPIKKGHITKMEPITKLEARVNNTRKPDSKK